MSRLVFCLVASLVIAALSACATVREHADPALKPDGKATKVESDDVLVYSVSQTVNAPPEKVWALITDAQAIPQWYTDAIRVDGKIADGEEIALHSKLRPDEPFNLKVTIVEPGKKMTWEDGMPMGLFAGVRTYTVAPQPDGTTLVTMSEVFSGGMLGMIKGELPDFRPSFETWASDLKKAAEAEGAKEG